MRGYRGQEEVIFPVLITKKKEHCGLAQEKIEEK